MRGSVISAFVCAALVSANAVAEPTDDALLQQDVNKLEDKSAPDTVLEIDEKDPQADILSRFPVIARYFALMDQPLSEDRQAKMLDRIRRDPESAPRAIELFGQLGEAAKPENGYFAEARWRTMYLLGELGTDVGTEFMFKLATTPLPEAGRQDETEYRSEFRLRARAIDGLRKAKAEPLLRRIWESKSLVSGMAAAALFELGKAPDGVRELDPELVIGKGDPTDVNESRSYSATKLPRSGPQSTAREADIIIPGNNSVGKD